jgi:hypothetical protein
MPEHFRNTGLVGCDGLFDAFRVAPELFERVTLAHVRVEDVDNYVAVVEHDPTARGEAVMIPGVAAVIAGTFGCLLGNGFQLWLGQTGTDDQIVGDGGNFPYVEDKDVFGFFVRGRVAAESG